MRRIILVLSFLFTAAVIAGVMPGYAVTYAGSKECAECHLTETDNYQGHSHSKAKGPIPGETGIGCESCHGSGVNHVNLIYDRNKQTDDIMDFLINSTPDMKTCGGCHGNVNDTTIKLASDNLIQYMQSYNELTHAGRMSVNTCEACHIPHVSSKTAAGFNTTCANCHTQSVKIPQMAGKVPCQACHMPFAVTAAKGTMVKDYQKGEYRAHLFSISIDPAYKLNDGAGNATLGKDGFAHLTVDMTCAACHQTGAAPALTRAQLLENAPRVHN